MASKITIRLVIDHHWILNFDQIMNLKAIIHGVTQEELLKWLIFLITSSRDDLLESDSFNEIG